MSVRFGPMHDDSYGRSVAAVMSGPEPGARGGGTA